jgi:hypothetical protein
VPALARRGHGVGVLHGISRKLRDQVAVYDFRAAGAADELAHQPEWFRRIGGRKVGAVATLATCE